MNDPEKRNEKTVGIIDRANSLLELVQEVMDAEPSKSLLKKVEGWKNETRGVLEAGYHKKYLKRYDKMVKKVGKISEKDDLLRFFREVTNFMMKIATSVRKGC